MNAPRPSCIQCVRKHLGQAAALFQEALQGYPDHRWLAIGHLAEAEAESQGEAPDLANLLRSERKKAEQSEYIPDCIKLLSIVAPIEGAVKEALIARNRGKIEELDYNRPTTHEHVTHAYRGNLDTVVASRFAKSFFARDAKFRKWVKEVIKDVEWEIGNEIRDEDDVYDYLEMLYRANESERDLEDLTKAVIKWYRKRR